MVELAVCNKCGKELDEGVTKCPNCVLTKTQTMSDKVVNRFEQFKAEFSQAKFQFDYTKWKIGAKLICASAIVAFVSLLMPWTDIGIASKSGFGLAGILLLLLFTYPVLAVLKNLAIIKPVGIACGVIGLIGATIYYSTNSVSIFNESTNISGSGLFVYMIAAIVLMVATYLYKPVPKSE